MPKWRRKKSGMRHVIGNFILLGIVGFLFVSGSIMLWVSTLNIPDLNSFEQRKVAQSTKIYDRTGEILLFDIHENIKRTIVPFKDISRHIKNATVAIEDAEFYEHRGIKPKAILRAILVNVSTLQFSQGGSTITQQVVKNSILTTEKKISRKLKEWVLALKLEQKLSKESILELYLNESPYGGNLYGIAEASKAFFGKEVSDLTLAESAYLAALPQAPTYYSPYGNHRDKLDERKNLVLAKMYENKFITKDEFESALSEETIFKSQSNVGIQAPHFVIFIREYLEEKYGKRAIEERGFKVITTLDFKLQQKAEKIVAKFALENVEKFNATNASLIAIDPKTGQILTMVGSRDYFDEEIDGNFNVTLAHRQPGSAFKPFVYATAFNRGYTTETVIFDVQTQFSTTCEFDNLTLKDNCYAPGNYDNIFRGPVTFREALAQSINVPSVKVLYLAGLSDSLQTARSMGIQSLSDIDRYGLTLVLGGGEVSLIDITGAYGTFANEGIRNLTTGILRIEDSTGNIVEEFTPSPLRVLSDQTALRITDILSDNEARAPAFGNRSFLYFSNRDVAVKTGTTNDYRDAWIIGYTPSITVGAWAGNNDNTPMEKKVAGFIIAPLWKAFMLEVFKDLPAEKFRTPLQENDITLSPLLRGFYQGGESYFIDSISGKRATEFTPLELREERVFTNTHSILYWVDKKNPRGPAPVNPEQDPQFKAWEYAVSLWKEKGGIVFESSTSTKFEFDDIHKPEFRPKLTITNPKANVRYKANDRIFITVQSEPNKFPLSKIDVFINGIFIDSVMKEPFSLMIIPDDLTAVLGRNTLKVIGYDTVFNKSEVEIIFDVNL